MENAILQKVQKDSAYSQIVQIYSGLFDTQDERETFILDVAGEDVLLAAECKMGSVEQEILISEEIAILCNSILNENANLLSYYNALMALLRLEKTDLIHDFLIKIKPQNIGVISQIINQIPVNQASFELLTTILLTNPSYFIRDFLKMSDSFIEKSIYFKVENTNIIFSELLKNDNIKVSQIFYFLKKNIHLIEIGKHRQLAMNKLLKFRDLSILLEWINIFKLKVSFKKLIIQLLESNNNQKSIYVAIQLFEYIERKDVVNILDKMQKSDRESSKIAFYLFININYVYKLSFRDYVDYYIKIDKDCFNSFEKFKINYLKVYHHIKKEEYRLNLKVGDIITVNYANKSLYHYTFKINSPVSHSYLLHFEEIPKDTQIKKQTPIKVKVIYKDDSKNEVYISLTQLDAATVYFNKEYLIHFNIEDIVNCRIRIRYENYVSVNIYGSSKKQNAIIKKGKDYFEGITRLSAKVVQIIDKTLILEPIDIQKDENHKSVYMNLIDIKKSNLPIMEKLNIFLFENFIKDEKFTIHDINNKITYITEKNLTELFPTRKWFINILLDLDYIKKINSEFIVLKKIEQDFFEKVKERLIAIDFNSIIFDKMLLISQIVECFISKIINSRIHVRIENETRPASIYIGELSNKYIPNIFDFEYNGEKLHIGQKLIAKVISIDEKGRINLSLKQVEKNSH